MAGKNDEDKIALEDSGPDDVAEMVAYEDAESEGSEDVAELARYEEAESKALDEDWAYLDANHATSGSGWYITWLESYQADSFNVGDFFKCSPSGEMGLQALPGDHPHRAIFSFFKHALARYGNPEDKEEIIVRIYCYQLTDLYILDLLMHYCRIFPIHIILHPQLRTFQKIRLNIDNFLRRAKASGALATEGSPEQLVKLLNVRVVRRDNLGVFACMHRKEIMMSDVSLVGSYNLSTNARKNNWETMDLIATNPKKLEVFDELWGALESRKVDLLSPRKELLPLWEHQDFDKWMAELSSQKAPSLKRKNSSAELAGNAGNFKKK